MGRRRAGLAADLTAATGGDRTALLGDLVLVDADLATVPGSIGATTERYALARLAYLARVLDLANAEGRRLVAATDASLTALGKARQALDRASGYLDTPPNPAKQGGFRADVARLAAAAAPDVERYRRATEAAAMVRCLVGSAFGEGVRSFAGPDRTTVAWETVATRAGESAANRARQAAAA